MHARAAEVVGRDSELALIEESLLGSRQGRGRALFLVGEGGIGKSRLVAEATGAALGATMRVLRGRSGTIGPMVPLRPLTEALMPLSRGGDPLDETVLGPYRAVLGRLIPDWRGDTQPDQSSLVVLGEAVLRLLVAVGGKSGSVLILEDLHDADTETLAVVEYLIDNLEQLPVMLLATVRAEPGDALGLANAAARRGAGTLLRLPPLSRPDVTRLIASCLDAGPERIPADVLELVWRDSAGNPFLAEELLQGIIGDGSLVRDGGDWRLTGDLRRTVPSALVQGVIHRTDRLGTEGRMLMSAAAVLGRRFPLSVLQQMTGTDDRSLLSHLHAGVAAQLVVPDEPAPDWYAFRHPLTAEALLTQLTPTGRAGLCERAADAVEALHPGLEGDWCPLVASLRSDAGDALRAGRLFAEAGRRALADGAVGSAVALLDRAERLLATGPDTLARAEALEALLPALAETGDVERALSLADSLRELVGGGLGASRLAALHTRLAQVAHVAGRWADGNDQIARARALLGPEPDEVYAAQIDVVAAHLTLDTPGPNRTQRAGRLVSRAIDAAERHDLPLVACQAWELLGVLARERDLSEASACLQQVLETADRHGLPLQRMYALTRLGGIHWLAAGDTGTLAEAREEAQRLGAVPVVYAIDGIRVLNSVLLGGFAEARELSEECLTMATRLRLTPVARYVLMARATLAAHQGDREAMDGTVAEFRRMGGTGSQEEPLLLGLAGVFCALLEEDRPRAVRELAAVRTLTAENPTTFHLDGRHGVGLLLDVLGGTADRERFREVAGASAAQMRWNRHFVLLADAVLLGREGKPEAATEAARVAEETAAPHPTALHLGHRLVAETAHAAKWGEPEAWLRRAEHHFQQASVPTVAGACRALLRQIGAPVRQHRAGSNRIPTALRTQGVTVREYEVFQLLAERLSNKAIATRLYISPRTVEKHIASLITKTDQPNRSALCELSASQ
ncbi:AAA family ATPase [Streptomyces sp. NPDC002018]|uniref:helix-turn-helix transcriptional regulator n=1 Tax=Streptomyces sp. NPDC002018 TaxID=3364629 RepID=UPI00368909BC